jgi:hypothetical protein
MIATTLQRDLTALAERFLGNVQDELIASAAAGEDQVTVAIDECIAYHHGKPCRAYPHACPDVRLAVVAADAAAEMVAAWLIATGAGPDNGSDDAVLEAAGDLIADAVAAAETARLAHLETT